MRARLDVARAWQAKHDRPSFYAGAVELPELTVQKLREAALTFSEHTGLGWDKWHPRSMLRLPDCALLALVKIFLLIEVLGHGPI